LRTIRRSARVPYSASQMFDLVNDVESYPRFLHWCRDAKIERKEGNTVEAALDIGVSGIHKRFTTRNTLERPHRIAIELISGPFRRLEGQWRFTDDPGGGSEVSLSLDFEVSHSPLSMLFSAVFEEAVRAQMSAFTKRATHVYG
jgi:ribosome-associated toxin RatA of RatAB toxin-antitoxin module